VVGELALADGHIPVAAFGLTLAGPYVVSCRAAMEPPPGGPESMTKQARKCHRANFDDKRPPHPLPLKKARPAQRHPHGPRSLSRDSRVRRRWGRRFACSRNGWWHWRRPPRRSRPDGQTTTHSAGCTGLLGETFPPLGTTTHKQEPVARENACGRSPEFVGSSASSPRRSSTRQRRLAATTVSTRQVPSTKRCLRQDSCSGTERNRDVVSRKGM
jgi:hypothetical protein